MNSQDITGLCHRISVKELPPVSPVAVIKVLELDFADTRAGGKEFLRKIFGSFKS